MKCMIRIGLVVAFWVIALISLLMMFTAETKTGKDFSHYAQWALAGGLLFLTVGAAMTAFEHNDVIKTPFDQEK